VISVVKGVALAQLGAVYIALGENQKALYLLRQALPIMRAAGDRRGEANTLKSIGDIYAGCGIACCTGRDVETEAVESSLLLGRLHIAGRVEVKE
jgi:hypothetical protein